MTFRRMISKTKFWTTKKQTTGAVCSMLQNKGTSPRFITFLSHRKN
ncbi:hypothetical protein CLOSTMETH_02287 [[Clostridium] methylpentosum DSM 5476]|uniref:Uncharacterized protein n=1 Tax=[Clostridium] methylpentosum DSM 5476 TaxID=537013 RepID=C0EEJ6_9FIRM|nr:hypothetical protein CLOSTMETH_02287 [[Clostridium] methylpentosum DSM 5476]